MTCRRLVSLRFRYITYHCLRIDSTFPAIVANGAEVFQKLRSMGKIVRIGFVKDPEGNVIEVAQRADLAGPFWEDKAKM